MDTGTPTAGEAADAAREDRLYRRVAWRIMPLLMLCYVAAYLDRVNVGFGKLQMSQQLGFSETVFGLGAGVFFLGYFIFELPSNVILHRIGARIWLARILVTWGIVSALFLFVRTPWQFYGLRFLLGLAEAGFYPGVILYLTYWFPTHRRGKMFALFQAGAPISGIIGNPVSGFIMQYFQDVGGLQGWQWMFLLEAVPAVILGGVLLLRLDNGIEGARWLDASDKALLVRNIAANQEGSKASHSVLEVLRLPMLWVTASIYFLLIMGQYGITFWLPTLVKASGVVGNFNIGLLSAIPYVCAVAAMVLFTRSADRLRERRWHIAVPAVIGAAGFVVAATAGSTTMAIVALSVATACVFSCAPLFWSLPTAFLSGVAAASGIAVINSCANLAGFVSPYMIGTLRDLTHSTAGGMYVLAGTLVLGGVIALCIPGRLVNR
ncbi:MAG: MFS transporter [Janthinobacterium lividum]